MARKPRARKGDVVRFKFLDHVEGGDEPLEFHVYGRVFKATMTAYVVDTWCYPEIDDPDRSSNVERFTILRSAISEVIIYGSEDADGNQRKSAKTHDPARKEGVGLVLGSEGTN